MEIQKHMVKFPSCCSDFRYKSNGIFVLGVCFFFFRQISTFLLAIFDRICFNRSKGIVVLSLNSKDILPVIAFRKVIDLKFAISANLGQLTVACHVAEYPESRKVNSSQDSRKINLFPDSRKINSFPDN